MYENKIKVGKRIMAYDPQGIRQYRFIGVIQSINKNKVVIYNEKLPVGYKEYIMIYNEVLQYFIDKLYK